MGIFILFLNMGTWKTKFAPHGGHGMWALYRRMGHMYAATHQRIPIFLIVMLINALCISEGHNVWINHVG
jgi:hypothetical protein